MCRFFEGEFMEVFSRARLIIPAVIGNILEWYSFALYACLASFIRADLFPEANFLVSTIQTTTILSLGYFARPFGALFFGFLADRFGRKKVLPIAMLIMAVSTTLIAFIPTYHVIGIWSGILLVFFRIIQGFSVGGEYASSIVYILEQAPKKRQGFWAGLFCATGYLGFFFGFIISFFVVRLCENTPYEAYAWRFPFILAVFLGVLGLYLRRKLPETPSFIQAQKEDALVKNPFFYLFKHNVPSLFKGMGLCLLPSALSCLLFSYLPTYIRSYGGLSLEKVLFVSVFSCIVAIVALPIFGFFSDYFGRFIFILLGCVLLFLSASFLFQEILGSAIESVILAVSALTILLSSVESMVPATLVSLFPIKARCSGIAFSLNLTNAIFGGTAPLFATILIHNTGSLLAPSWYTMVAAAIAGLALIPSYKNLKKQRLVD